MDSTLQGLRHLARLYQVQSEYYDVLGQLRRTSPEGLIEILRVLGAPLERLEDAPEALRARREFLWRRAAEPVLVAWEGGPVEFELRLPAGIAAEEILYHIQLEGGGSLGGACVVQARKPREKEIEGIRYIVQGAKIPVKLPYGYHHTQFQIEGKSAESLMISAPVKAYAFEEGRKKWGGFLPLYALRSEPNWGAGNFSDLERLMAWVSGLGGKMIGTLPLLATFLDEPFDPSPYSPISRFFWNEFYVDPTALPEFERCAEARAIMASADFENEMAKLRAAPLIDYRRLMALKRRILEALAASLFAGESERHGALRSFVEANPPVQDYARFRAMTDSRRKPWTIWPEPYRSGLLRPGECADELESYHLYAQWVAHEQMESLVEKTKRRGAALYLDLPLGVHRDGYDVWRERDSFAPEASGGAPPDSVFTRGQNWGFPPLHPEGLRQNGYRYFIACLRHHLKHSGLLRIDHVMGLHRLFWIPQDCEPSDGAYVHYRAEELYAILSLESHRHRAAIIGENLGTVPPYVNTALERHGIYGMYVGQFEARPDPERALGEAPPKSVASLNTHDTPPFAGFWQGLDIEDRLAMGLLDEAKALSERETRSRQKEALTAFLKRRGLLKEDSPHPAAVLRAWLNHLAAGAAEILLINLEDLWLEEKPQNVPSTWSDRPNWQRKARYFIEEFSPMADLVETLKEISQRRAD